MALQSLRQPPFLSVELFSAASVQYRDYFSTGSLKGRSVLTMARPSFPVHEFSWNSSMAACVHERQFDAF